MIPFDFWEDLPFDFWEDSPLQYWNLSQLQYINEERRGERVNEQVLSGVTVVNEWWFHSDSSILGGWMFVVGKQSNKDIMTIVFTRTLWIKDDYGHWHWVNRV
jgi:hypothetical protein